MMTNSADRRRAARTAYRALLAAWDGQLPVDPEAILKKVKRTRLMRYTDAGRRLGCSVYALAGIAPSELAFTMECTDETGPKYLVLYNDDACFGVDGTRRWSLAHELGHILLGHFAELEPIGTARPRPVMTALTPEKAARFEAEANCFAQHLLCPRPLTEALPPADVDMLRVAFGLSASAASIALQGMRAPCPLVDEDMRGPVMKLFGLGEKATWESLLRPAQQVAYNVRKRRRTQGALPLDPSARRLNL